MSVAVESRRGGRAERERHVNELRELIKGSQGMVFVNTLGLDSAETFELRKAMRPVRTRLKVVKNRLMRIACKEEKIPLNDDWLLQNTTVAFIGQDSIGTVKTLTDYAAAHEKFQFKGALIDGQPLGLDGIKTLAALPGRVQMLTGAATAMRAPFARGARSFGSVFVKMAMLLKEASKKVS